MNWLDYFSNARGHQVKHYCYEMLQERYAKNEPIIDRLSVSLVTESDIKTFLELLADVYERAYLKAVEDHREQLQKLGLAARVVAPPKS